AMNIFEVIKLKQANRWNANLQENQWNLGFATASKCSSLEKFSLEAINSWFLVIMYNVCSALRASNFSYKGFHLTKRVPQYQQKMKAYLEANPDQRNNIGKVVVHILCLETE
ncbi:hypothetical protein KIN20_014654, partial [Parelaphostrongylus tenuis]